MKALTDKMGKLGANRIWLAPLTNLQSHEDGSVSDTEIEWLKARAEGGFGLVMTCATHVAREGQGWPGQFGISDDRFLPGLFRLAAAIKDAGGVAIAQIFHGGRRSPADLIGRPGLSPSGFEGSSEMSRSDVLRVIEDFGRAAKRAEWAGFSGVEIHGAHGYLISQFLSRDENMRSDEWGVTDRTKFLRDIIESVRAHVTKDFIVGLRLSVVGYARLTGIEFEDSKKLIQSLSPDQIDFLDASLWDFRLQDPAHPEKGVLIPQIREVLDRRIPLAVAGAIRTHADASEALSMGADAVVLGKIAIGNADWPKRVLNQGLEPLLPPYSKDHLRAQKVGEAFIQYLERYPDFLIKT